MIRLRELHISQQEEEQQQKEEQTCHSSNSSIYKEFQNEIISKFPQESLHSFRFSSPTSTSNIREELLRKKKRLHGTLPGHHQFSVKQSATTKTKTVGSPISNHQFMKKIPPISESPPTATSTTTTQQQQQQTTQSKDTSRTMSNSSSLSSNSSTTTPPTTEDEYDEEEEEDEEEETYVPHLHNRLKQQSQAILTTYDDWRIILTNSIAQDALVSHLHHQMNEEQDMLLVGKSVMDLVEPNYQTRLTSLIVKRRNELINDENIEGGMVLVCGNVVSWIII